ncbi:hypothetical protein ACFL35_21355, partial [Candidatus Riflebacteria bacterium]
LFIADAGLRRVLAFDLSGKHLWITKGIDGFVIPSPYFDLCSDAEEGIWVVNPGRHRLEQYDRDGKFRAMWKPDQDRGFLGCCNPAHFVRLDGNQFVTLEKGITRSRLFAPSGKLMRLIAGPENFLSKKFNYELVAGEDTLYILDTSNNMVFIFDNAFRSNIKPEGKSYEKN